MKPGEIAVELDIHKSQVSRHLQRARRDGKLTIENGLNRAN